MIGLGRFWAFCGAGVLVGCNAMLDIEPGRPRPAENAADAPDCSTHGDCLDQNSETRPRACIAGRCVELISDECPLLLPQSDRLWLDNLRSDPEPVIIGVYTSIAPNLYGPVPRNFDLALTEFTREVQGLPTTGGGRRAVVALVCGNLYEDKEALDRSIDHLALELEVPGIISQLATEDLQRVFERSADRHLFFANTLGSEINDRVIPDGLLWSMLPRERELVPIYEPLFELLVEHLRKRGKLGSKEEPRVALVAATDYPPTADLASAVTSTFEKGLVAADHFRTFTVKARSFAAKDYSEVLQELRAFEPHVVLSASTQEFLLNIVPALEAAGPELAPTYVLSPDNYDDPQLFKLTKAIPDFNQRVLGVNYARAADQTLRDGYQARFNAENPWYASPPALFGNENYYDAAYYLLYAGVAARGATPLTGPDLRFGMRRLLSGAAGFDVGPGDLSAAYAALQTQPSIELTGTLGPPDFDPQTGTRAAPGTVWCVQGTTDVRFDVLRIDDNGQLTGDFPCFELP